MKNLYRTAIRAFSAAGAALWLATVVWAGPIDDANRLYRSGDYQAALSILQQAQGETPEDPRVYAALGKTYRKLGDNNAARDAYTEFLRLDPKLSILKNDQERRAFLQAFRSIGGQIPEPTNRAPRESGPNDPNTSAQDIIRGLTEGNVFVVPPLRGEIDQQELEGVAASLRPLTVKTLVVNGLGGYQSREELAEDLRRRLNLNNDAVLVVATPKGVSATSGRLGPKQITDAIQGAGLDSVLATEGPTAMIAAAMRTAAQASRADRTTDTGTGVAVVGLLALGAGGWWLSRRAKHKREMRGAKERVEGIRQEVIKHLSYVDGYLDLLPASDEATRAKQLRASAFEKFDTANGLIKTAEKPEQVEQALPLLTDARQELEQCRQAIDIATGGTGVAMGIVEIPDLATDVEKAKRYRKLEELRTAEERARAQKELEALPAEERGVSFFSGRPMPASTLVPVTAVIAGHKRTVMATPEEAEMIRNGEMPPIRSFKDPETGRYIPWYENRRYDPYRDYYSYNDNLLAASVMLNMLTLTSMMGPGIYSNYGPWGWHGYGWGMPVPVGGYYAFDQQPASYGYDSAPVYQSEPAYEPEHAGGMDFFGQGGYEEQSDSFDFGGDGDSRFGGFGVGDDGGGFDFGGGDGGGFDFGGGGDW
ncbi:MAG: hypothetical protein OHK0029_11080 [Armatimonadaceae bacterium]